FHIPPIQLPKLSHQHLLRPPVRHDVVQRQQQHILLLPHPHQPRPQQRPLPQIKSPPRLLPPQPLHLLLHSLPLQPTQITDPQPYPSFFPHHLHRPFPSPLKRCPQRLVPPHYLPQPLLNCNHIHTTFN